jgi:hypothetical protein
MTNFSSFENLESNKIYGDKKELLIDNSFNGN